jgi:hypothetical protein
MIHVGLHSVGTYHKKFGRQNKKIKIYFVECLIKTLGKDSFVVKTDGHLPSATFAECFTLGKRVFAKWGPVPSVQHSVKRLVPRA